jgi:hypothetical protein
MVVLFFKFRKNDWVSAASVLRKLSFYQSLALDDNICKSVSIVGPGAAS